MFVFTSSKQVYGLSAFISESECPTRKGTLALVTATVLNRSQSSGSGVHIILLFMLEQGKQAISLWKQALAHSAEEEVYTQSSDLAQHKL
jgi:hypothetical protein